MVDDDLESSVSFPLVQPTASRASIASDSANILLVRVVAYAIAFVASVVMSRVLGPAGRGQYYLPVLTATTLFTICTVGLEHANVVLLGNQRASIEALWSQAGAIAIVMGIVGTLATVNAPLLLAHLYSDTPRTSLWLAGVTIPLLLHTQFAAGLLTMRGMVTWQFKGTIAGGSLQALLLVALAAGGRLTVTTVLVVNLVVAIATWAVMIAPFRNRGAWVGGDRRLFRETIAQAIPLHAASVILYLHLRADMFMVEAFLGATALGLYSLAVTLAETVSIVTDSLSIAILPRQVGNTLIDAARLALRGVRANILLGITLAAAWTIAGVIAIPVVFGRAYAPAYRSLVFLLPGIVFLGVQRVCGPAVLRSSRPWRIVAIQGFSLSCNLALNLWTIPRLGPPGAAVASAVSYALGATIFVVWTTRLAETRIRHSAIPRLADVEDLLRQTRVVLSLLKRASIPRR